MPVIYEGRCSICKSPHRAEIEQFVRDNKPRMPWKKITQHIQENFDIQTGMSSIWTHMRSHCDLSEEIRDQYVESRSADVSIVPIGMSSGHLNDAINAAEVAIRSNVAEIEKLDDMIQRDFDTYVEVSDLINDQLRSDRRVDRNLVELLKTLNGNINTTMKTRMEMLGEDTGSRQAAAMNTWVDLMRDL